MTSIPLHPALVHLPLGLAFVLPILALGFSWALWKGHARHRAWGAVVLLQVLLLGAGLVAMKTGQREEPRVEAAVPEAALERHEKAAEQFLWATGITLAPAALVLVFREPRAIRAFTALTVLGTALVAAAAMRVGHAGGQLVYAHNAAAVYSSPARNNLNPEAKPPSPRLQPEKRIKMTERNEKGTAAMALGQTFSAKVDSESLDGLMPLLVTFPLTPHISEYES